VSIWRRLIVTSPPQSADGTRAAAENRDFGTAHRAAQWIGYISRAEWRKGAKPKHDIHAVADVVDEPLGDQNLSVDGVLDTVAGKSFGAYVAALRPTGVLSLVGAVGGSNVSFDAYRLLEVKLTGYASDTLDGAALRRAISSISEWVSRGIIRAPVRSVFPLQEAAAAHAKLEQHLVQGRVLLVAPDWS